MKLAWLTVAAALTAAAGPAAAAEISAACKPVVAALEKTIQTDHTAESRSDDRIGHMVLAGGKSYVEFRGTWHSSPLGAQEMLAQSRENVREASEFTCRSAGDAIVDGVRAATFSTHSVNDGTISDANVAVAKDTGLLLRTDTQLSGDTQAHNVTRYGYTNVKAPM